jgi:membrane-associated phospholipid phosphatase
MADIALTRRTFVTRLGSAAVGLAVGGLAAVPAAASGRPRVAPDWLPLLVTPPFPEYPSGHSVQSGAAFQVLTDLFGNRYRFVDRTHDDRGFAPRRFRSFLEAADEVAISRLYGGIHFRAAIENGVAQGRRIGRAASGLQLRGR